MNNSQISSAELQKLSDFLDKNADMGIVGLHGMITAIMTSPAYIPMKQWLPDILKDSFKFKSAEAELKINKQLMKFCDLVFHDLQNKSLMPMLSCRDRKKWSKKVDRDALTSWCMGYMSGTSFYQDLWNEATNENNLANPGTALLLIITISVDKETMVENNIMNVPQGVLDQLYTPEKQESTILGLPSVVQNLYGYWKSIQELVEESEELEGESGEPIVSFASNTYHPEFPRVL